MKIKVLYRDDDIIVVDKPAGIPTHAPEPSDPYPGDALRVVQQQEGLGYLGMHQRLDADTSGVLLFSLRPEANRTLAAAFEGRAARKVYFAAVLGAPEVDESTIDAPIARDRDGRYKITTRKDPSGQPARHALPRDRTGLDRQEEPGPAFCRDRGDTRDRPHPPNPPASRPCRPPRARRRSLRGQGRCLSSPLPPRRRVDNSPSHHRQASHIQCALTCAARPARRRRA